MEIPLQKLNYTFRTRPLLVGGKAMEYYGLRQAGRDIDLIAEQADVYALIKLYPERVKDLWGDLGVCPFEFEIWKSICLLPYADLCAGAVDEGDFLVISLEKLLMMKGLAMHIEKYHADTQLIVQALQKRNYQSFEQVKTQNQEFIQQVPGVVYIEKSGPEG